MKDNFTYCMNLLTEITKRSHNLAGYVKSNSYSVKEQIIDLLKELKDDKYPLLGIYEYDYVDSNYLEKQLIVSYGSIVLGQIRTYRLEKVLVINKIVTQITFEFNLNKNSNKTTTNDTLKMAIQDDLRVDFIDSLSYEFSKLGLKEDYDKRTSVKLVMILIEKTNLKDLLETYISLSLQYSLRNKYNSLELGLNEHLLKIIRQ